jgi:hypothetical protein
MCYVGDSLRAAVERGNAPDSSNNIRGGGATLYALFTYLNGYLDMHPTALP